MTDEYSKGFLTFWSVYPNRKGKAAAMRAWKTHKCEPLTGTIAQHLQKRVKRDKQWLDNGGKYVPMPTTFINQHRWEDEYDEIPDPKKPIERAKRDEGPVINPFVMQANRVLFSWLRNHYAKSGEFISEAAMTNMVKNKNQMALMLEEDTPDSDSSKEYLQRFYRSLDAIMDKQRTVA